MKRRGSLSVLLLSMLGSPGCSKPKPPEGDQALDTKLSVRLESFAVLAPYAFKLKPLLYRLRGIAKVGGDRLNIDVPFSVEGVLTPQELLATGLRDAGLTLPK